MSDDFLVLSPDETVWVLNGIGIVNERARAGQLSQYERVLIDDGVYTRVGKRVPGETEVRLRRMGTWARGQKVTV